MPKVKGGCVYKKNYNKNDIEKALETVKNGISRREASKMYNVPRATLQFRLSEKFIKERHGPSSVLT